MKKIVLITILSIVGSSLQARWIVHKVNGGPDGYAGVGESTSDNGDHHLSCSNPGTSACKWSSHTVPYNEDEVDAQLNYLIDIGITDGAFTTPDGRQGEFMYIEEGRMLEYIIY